MGCIYIYSRIFLTVPNLKDSLFCCISNLSSGKHGAVCHQLFSYFAVW